MKTSQLKRNKSVFLSQLKRNLWYNIRMKQRRLTPADAKNIVARVNAGDKQQDIAADYGVNKSTISRIVKRHREKIASSETKIPAQRDYSEWTTENLLNRRRECYREISEIHSEVYNKKSALDRIREGIKADTKELENITDDGFRRAVEIGITAKKAQLTELKGTKRLAFSLAVLHNELSGLLHALSKRDDWLPIGDTIESTVTHAERF